MARNPKDLVVSYYQFHRSLRTMSYRGTFQEFCRRFMNDKCKEHVHMLLHMYFHLCIPSASTEMKWIKVQLFCLQSREVATDKALHGLKWMEFTHGLCELWLCLLNNCLTITHTMGSIPFYFTQANSGLLYFLKFSLQGSGYPVKSGECAWHLLLSVLYAYLLLSSLSAPEETFAMVIPLVFLFNSET